MKFLKTLCVIFALMFGILPLSLCASSPLEKTISNIEHGDYMLNIYQINTKDGVREHLGKYISGLAEHNVDVIGITVTDFTSAENGVSDGSFSFFAELSYRNTRKTTKTIIGTISRVSIAISASTLQSSIFAGEELTLNADVSNYDGGKIRWYESSNPNKNGKMISETKATHITVSPNVGTKYYYCIYKGSVSNTVAVKVTEAFVPISDITLPSISLVCNKSTPLSAEIYPENATKTDIVWEVAEGDATVTADRITVRKSGIITVKATVMGGGEKGVDYEKFFEFYAEEGSPEYKEIKWSVLPPVDGILQMNFTAGEKKDVQITSVSDLTANKMIASANAHSNMEIIAGVYVVCDDVNALNEVTMQLASDYADKEVHVISSDNDGNISHENLTISESGEITLPKHKSTYVVTSERTSRVNLSFLVLLLPLIPLILIPIFFRIGKNDEQIQNKK